MENFNKTDSNKIEIEIDDWNFLKQIINDVFSETADFYEGVKNVDIHDSFKKKMNMLHRAYSEMELALENYAKARNNLKNAIYHRTEFLGEKQYLDILKTQQTTEKEKTSQAVEEMTE